MLLSIRLARINRGAFLAGPLPTDASELASEPALPDESESEDNEELVLELDEEEFDDDEELFSAEEAVALSCSSTPSPRPVCGNTEKKF